MMRSMLFDLVANTDDLGEKGIILQETNSSI